MYMNIDHTHLQRRRRPPLCASYLGPLPVLFTCLTIMLVACAVTHTAAATTPSVTLVTLTDQDNGKSVQLSVGQTLAISLPSNPTTGYQWSVVGNSAPLEFVKSDYTADPQTAGRMGAGGTQTLRFTAKLSGRVELKLGYARPWEKDVPPAKTFSATIVVK